MERRWRVEAESRGGVVQRTYLAVYEGGERVFDWTLYQPGLSHRGWGHQDAAVLGGLLLTIVAQQDLEDPEQLVRIVVEGSRAVAEDRVDPDRRALMEAVWGLYELPDSARKDRRARRQVNRHARRLIVGALHHAAAAGEG